MSEKTLTYWRTEQLARTGPEADRLPFLDQELSRLWRELPESDRAIIRAASRYRELEDQLFELRRVQGTYDAKGADALIAPMEALWETLEGSHQSALNEGPERTKPDPIRMGDFFQAPDFHPVLCVWRDGRKLVGTSLVTGEIVHCDTHNLGVKKIDRHTAIYSRLCGPLDAWTIGDGCPWPREKRWWTSSSVQTARSLSRMVPIRAPKGWKVYPGWGPEGGGIEESSNHMHFDEDIWGATGAEWVIDIGSYGNSHEYTCMAMLRRPAKEAFPDEWEWFVRNWKLSGPEALVVDWRNPDDRQTFPYPEQATRWAERWMHDTEAAKAAAKKPERRS